MNSSNQSIIEFACRLAGEINAKAVLLYDEVSQDIPMKGNDEACFDTILVTKKLENKAQKSNYFKKIISIPDVSVTRLSQVKIAVTKGIAAGLFGKDDKLVCLTGLSRFGYIDSMFIIDVGREFEVFTPEGASETFDGVNPEVFDALLNIALELAEQGREGRPVGTIFVAGDHERVLQLSRQMIINPFMGYKEEERNVVDKNLRETIKEFSAIDGAFIVKEDGVLVAAGRHLSAALESKDFPKGLGSRHIAAAGITGVTNAIALVVSESSGDVRIFKKGKIFVDIEKVVE